MTLAEAFAEASPRLQAALDKAGNTHSLDDVWYLVATNQVHLWHAAEYSGITEVLKYPQKTVVSVWLVGGDLEAIMALAEEGGDIHRYAAIVGASEIELLGRRGWTKALAPLGFNEQLVKMTKEV